MTALAFLTRRRGGPGWHWTDIVTWAWLVGGLLLIFGPALWLVASSFKSPQQLAQFPPTLLPYVAQTATVNGEEKPLYRVTFEDGTTRTLAELRRVGIVAQMVDPAAPDETLKVPIADRTPVRSLGFAWSNYTEPFLHFDFLTYLRNSVFVTVAATLITLLTNSMAAFALSKYDFRGRGAVMLLIIATLMIPLSVILVPLYSVISAMGLFNSLWGVILPTVATPTGVFLLRQYMLTIPDELIDAARMDKASRMADLLAHRPPPHRPRPRRPRHLLRRLALERLPLAPDRPLPQGALHPAGRPQHLRRRAQRPVALHPRHDRRDHDPRRPRLRLPATLHHHRHRLRGDQVTMPTRAPHRAPCRPPAARRRRPCGQPRRLAEAPRRPPACGGVTPAARVSASAGGTVSHPPASGAPRRRSRPRSVPLPSLSGRFPRPWGRGEGGWGEPRATGARGAPRLRGETNSRSAKALRPQAPGR